MDIVEILRPMAELYIYIYREKGKKTDAESSSQCGSLNVPSGVCHCGYVTATVNVVFLVAMREGRSVSVSPVEMLEHFSYLDASKKQDSPTG
jgi:hypothetical protein